MCAHTRALGLSVGVSLKHFLVLIIPVHQASSFLALDQMGLAFIANLVVRWQLCVQAAAGEMALLPGGCQAACVGQAAWAIRGGDSGQAVHFCLPLQERARATVP